MILHAYNKLDLDSRFLEPTNGSSSDTNNVVIDVVLLAVTDAN